MLLAEGDEPRHVADVSEASYVYRENHLALEDAKVDFLAIVVPGPKVSKGCSHLGTVSALRVFAFAEWK